MGIIFAATMMEPMINKTKRISYLMNPSSTLEKFLSRWIIVTIGYLIIFSLVIIPADATRVFISVIRYPGAEVPFIDFSKIVSGEKYTSDFLYDYKQLKMVLSLYILFQSLFVLGSTFWQKNSFVKTFSALLLIFVSYGFICYKLISVLFGNGMDDFFWSTRDFEPENQTTTIAVTLTLIAIVNWVIAFFRFRESEIIKRW